MHIFGPPGALLSTSYNQNRDVCRTFPWLTLPTLEQSQQQQENVDGWLKCKMPTY